MTTCTARWGGPDHRREVTVERVEMVDEALDKIAVDAEPYAALVRFHTSDTGDIEVLVGHPIRSMVAYTSPAGLRYYAVQPTLDPLGWFILGDRDGSFCSFPDHTTRVTPDAARDAVKEWFTTGRRPTRHVPRWVSAPAEQGRSRQSRQSRR